MKAKINDCDGTFLVNWEDHLIDFTYDDCRIRDSEPILRFDDQNQTIIYNWLNETFYIRVDEYQRAKQMCKIF